MSDAQLKNEVRPPVPAFAGDTLRVLTTVLAAPAAPARMRGWSPSATRRAPRGAHPGARTQERATRGAQPDRRGGGALRTGGADAPAGCAVKLACLLFAPGDSQPKAERALAGDADGVILDLEDSVAPAGKPAARGAVAAVLAGLAPEARRRVVVRVNPRGTPWYLDDLAAVIGRAPAAVLLPKCSGPADLAALDHHLEALEAAFGLPAGGIGVLALVTETAASLAAMDYRAVTPRLRALCFGAEDLSADLGVAPRDAAGRHPAPVAAARAATLLAAAAAGVAALDTPFPDPRDPEGLAAEAGRAAADGFAGKLLIHPAQIAPVRAAFTPSAERIAWAERVRDAFAAAPGAGVVTLDGRMLDQPHRTLAGRILAGR
jgi:citrate lyase subunit beta/citryl-CoA lyase